jgi:hypothetical protein
MPLDLRETKAMDLKTAADLAYKDYCENKELTVFTELDGEEVLEYGDEVLKVNLESALAKPQPRLPPSAFAAG